MYLNHLNGDYLRPMSRGRVRFTYRVTPQRANELRLWSNAIDWTTEIDGGTSYRFEVTKQGRVRVTRRNGDDDVTLLHYPYELVNFMLHDTALQGTLTNAIELATEAN